MFKLKLLSGVVLKGAIRLAGEEIEVAEKLAKDLQARGKAVLATVKEEAKKAAGK